MAMNTLMVMDGDLLRTLLFGFSCSLMRITTRPWCNAQPRGAHAAMRDPLRVATWDVSRSNSKYSCNAK